MASPILATGAGAGAGLEELLTRMLKEKQLAEETRHNQAAEGLQGREIDLNSKLREDALARQTANDALNHDNQVTGRVLQRVNLSPIGSAVPGSEFGEDVTHGVPTGDFSFGSPGSVPLLPKSTIDVPGVGAVSGGAPDTVGSTLPMIQWKGSPAQQHQAAEDAKLPSDAIQKYTVGGKVVNALVPKTPGGPVIAVDGEHKGQDISSIGEPYTPPPGVTYIQTDNGVVAAPSKGGGPAKAVVGPDGKPIMPRSPASLLEKQDARARAGKLLDNLDHYIDTAATHLGPIHGRISDVETMVGNQDPTVAHIAALMLASKMSVDAGLGGMRGAASPQLLERWDKVLSMPVNPASLHEAVSVMKEMVANNPDDMHDSGSAALPTVGGTFNGGRVLSVTPVSR